MWGIAPKPGAVGRASIQAHLPQSDAEVPHRQLLPNQDPPPSGGGGGGPRPGDNPELKNLEMSLLRSDVTAIFQVDVLDDFRLFLHCLLVVDSIPLLEVDTANDVHP